MDYLRSAIEYGRAAGAQALAASGPGEPSDRERRQRLLHDVIELGAFATNVTGAVLLIFAVALTAFNLSLLLLCTLCGVQGRLFFPFDSRLHGCALSLTSSRVALGTLVCCALQLLVVADVVDTMKHPIEDLTFDMLGKLLLVVLIREGLAFVMAKELDHLLEHHNAHAVLRVSRPSAPEVPSQPHAGKKGLVV